MYDIGYSAQIQNHLVSLTMEMLTTDTPVKMVDGKPELVNRHPLPIFKEIKNAEDKEEKKDLQLHLKTLKSNIPEGYKIGAALREGNCFFDSVAQGLNEFTDKIANSQLITVKSLRESCKEYAVKITPSKDDSWLNHALRQEGEKLRKYISRIDIYGEEIENEISTTSTKRLKRSIIQGRPRIEGKMISERYGIQLRVIELSNGLQVTKSKIGKGKCIYLVSYKDHFCPLLRNIDKDVKKIPAICKPEANKLVSMNSYYPSNSTVQDVEQRVLENSFTGIKRKNSLLDPEFQASKKACMNSNIISDNLKSASCSQEELNSQGDRVIPYSLNKLMYQIDLSVYCLLRKLSSPKYSSVSLKFGNSKYEFNHIILQHRGKSVMVQVENVDTYFMSYDISFAKLFTKRKIVSNFFLSYYFDSFVAHKAFSKKKKTYLVIYTNAGLALNKDNTLKQDRSLNCFPFKFDSIDLKSKKFKLLKSFLFITNHNDHSKHDGGFYKFSNDEPTRTELFKQLVFSSSAMNLIEKSKLSPQGIKEEFIDTLIFAAKQPHREELNRLIKREVNSKVGYDYVELQKEVINNLLVKQKVNNNADGIIYQFYLLVLIVHDMFIHNKIRSISLRGKSHDDACSFISITYEDVTMYVNVLHADANISFHQLFPLTNSGSNAFSINKLFKLFVEELNNKKNLTHFIIYTNACLNLTRQNRFISARTKNFYPLQFDHIDIEDSSFLILRYCSFFDTNNLYKFSPQDNAKILDLLKFPPQKEEGKLSDVDVIEIKKAFVSKLIFAVCQPDRKDMYRLAQKRTENNAKEIPCKFEQLQEVTLRWLESHEFGPITNMLITKILKDINNNKSSYMDFQSRNIDEEIKFAKGVAGSKDTPSFYQFLEFLIKGVGKEYLQILKKREINLSNVSSILHRTGHNSASVFINLCNLWFDRDGNKTQYLKTFEDEGVNFSSVSNVLNGAGNHAASAFLGLYFLWFDENGSKTEYLKNLEDKGVNLASMASILSGAGANATKAFKDLYNLWFDGDGKKSNFLKTLEIEGINLANVSSILRGAGGNATGAFRALYNLWFDSCGNKSKYLVSFEAEGISLANISSILHGAGANASNVFKDLYDVCFDCLGNKTQYLKSLQDEGVNLASMSCILNGAGGNASRAFKDLFHLWFDKEGKQSKYLYTFKNEGINFTTFSAILSGCGAKAKQAFMDFHDLLFDENGKKSNYLKYLEEEEITLANMATILHKTGASASTVFKQLLELWFDEKGNKRHYLLALKKDGINLKHMSGMLSKSGKKGAKAFKDLHNLWFDVEGNKKKYLQTLEREDISLAYFSSILNGAGDNASAAFKDLYNLWFDDVGHKRHYLRNLQLNGVNLSNVSSILHSAGNNAVNSFLRLYSLWFSTRGKITRFLKTLKKHGLNLSVMSCVLNGAGVHAAKAYKEFYSLCFDVKGNKTQYLITLEAEGISLSNMSSILRSSGSNASKAFEDLFHQWFDVNGQKTQYLIAFEEEGIHLSSLYSIFDGTGINAARVFKDFYNVCFDSEGYKTHYLINLEQEGIDLSCICCILHKAGNSSVKVFKDLYSLWFDTEGNKTHYLMNLEREGVYLSNISCILYQAGSSSVKCFLDLYKLFFDEIGNRTECLENLREAGVNLSSMLSILKTGAGLKVEKQFMELYNMWLVAKEN